MLLRTTAIGAVKHLLHVLRCDHRMNACRIPFGGRHILSFVCSQLFGSSQLDWRGSEVRANSSCRRSVFESLGRHGDFSSPRTTELPEIRLFWKLLHDQRIGVGCLILAMFLLSPVRVRLLLSTCRITMRHRSCFIAKQRLLPPLLIAGNNISRSLYKKKCARGYGGR